ncbi:uncharacterized protein EV154DRAFT_482027 [Mucor mucedo]|uniref:uncharacterized protein n=1 Tax=Mucor mucedo TaxID=29922 RepID=UPI00221E68CE|nr:uncharacterized protein EV154DRAFT_482027 [Mucor mucedo]KAI7890606.1 hypothetical protein EV154DRAFT_482027 [Mucor mucedo]
MKFTRVTVNSSRENALFQEKCSIKRWRSRKPFHRIHLNYQIIVSHTGYFKYCLFSLSEVPSSHLQCNITFQTVKTVYCRNGVTFYDYYQGTDEFIFPEQNTLRPVGFMSFALVGCLIFCSFLSLN